MDEPNRTRAILEVKPQLTYEQKRYGEVELAGLNTGYFQRA
jgi:hypothetical protein